MNRFALSPSQGLISEVDQRVVPQILLACPEDRSDIFFFQSSGTSSNHRDLSKITEWPHNDSNQFPSHSWTHPIGSHDFMVYTQFV